MKVSFGDNFYEAEYYLSAFPDNYINSDKLIGQMHCWSRDPRKFFDQGGVYSISFADK